MSIDYRKGDATRPYSIGNKIIAHICNDIGAWGGGYTKSLSKRWTLPALAYRRMRIRKLGSVEFIKVEADIQVANIIGQRSIVGKLPASQQPPVRYWAIQDALKLVASKAKEFEATVHMPRIGCGLAGGKWDIIEPIIQLELVSEGIQAYVYDL